MNNQRQRICVRLHRSYSGVRFAYVATSHLLLAPSKFICSRVWAPLHFGAEHCALSLAREHTLIVEGADNLATKFLAADAARIARRPIVQAGVVRWAGWALASGNEGACLRCVFEDAPQDRVETCRDAGVVGSVVGVIGALAASLAIRFVLGDASAASTLYHHDALRGTLRRRALRARPDCPLCGARASIRAIDEARYVPRDTCAA